MKINYVGLPYNCFLKSGISQPSLSHYSQNIRVNKQSKDLVLNIHIKQDHVDFDKIEIISFLESDLSQKASFTTSYLIEAIEPQGWGVIASVTKESAGQKLLHSTTFNLSELPISFDGENTIRVTATTTRQGLYKKKTSYYNFIGIYESYLRNKSKIGFLQISKKDE